MIPYVIKRIIPAFAAVGIWAATPVQAQPMPQPVKIAIALFGPHDSLQDLVDGFKKEIAAEGIKATYDEAHVNFDRSLAPQMLNRMAAANPDLMVTITTPLTQTAKQVLAARKFPIVFSAVTDPVAAKVVTTMDRGDALMTGASHLANMEATVAFIKQLVPTTKRLGMLYNTGDDADVSSMKSAEAAAKAQGVEFVKVGVDSANDIPVRVQSLQGRVDALFLPSSNLLQPAGSAIASVANRIKLPVFNSNAASIESHLFLAAYTVDYDRLGVNTAKIAGQIIMGKKPSEIPVSFPTSADHEMRISGQRLKALGLALPTALKDCNCVIN